MTTLDELLHRPGPGPHRISLLIDGRAVETLSDLPPERGGLLFVGLNPSPASVRAGHYHEGAQGRRLWSRLRIAGVIPGQAAGLAGDAGALAADDVLVAAGHGITDLVKRPGPHDSIGEGQARAGVGPLWQKVALWRPGAVVFIDRRAAVASAGRPLGEAWGQLTGVALGGRPCFLMPAPDAEPDEVDEGLNLLRNLARSLTARP